MHARTPLILREVLSTETNYVECLRVCVNLYIGPFRELQRRGDAIVDRAEITTLFSNMESILMANEELLSQLNKAMPNPDGDLSNARIGKVFQAIAPYLNLYKIYAANYNKGVTLCRELLKKRKSFALFYDEKKAQAESKNLSLESLLIMPVQRIPRYKMLLEDLLKHTVEEERAELAQSLETIAGVATQVNETIRMKENQDKICEIEDSFITTNMQLVTPTRHWVRDGELNKVCRKNNKVYTFFLFNDLLLYSEQVAGRNKLHRKLDLSDNQFGITDVADTPAHQHAFTIRNSVKSFVVFAETAADKAAWVRDIEACLEHSKSRIHHGEKARSSLVAAPVWAQDRTTSECKLCRTKFSLTRRRHHCRKCGCVVCSSCSPHKHDLPHEHNARVCNECLFELQHKKALEDNPDQPKMLTLLNTMAVARPPE